MNGKTNAQPPAQRHIADNLNAQLGVIMVQMGHIIKAQGSDDVRADIIVENARKKMIEATSSFHSTLDDMEIEIMRAKAVFLRDLDQLRGKKQTSQSVAAPAPVAPPAPMVIDLDDFKPAGPSVPVAPMMATGGSPYIANRGIPTSEGKPVAPFPDMGAPGIPPPKPTGPGTVPFARAKPPIDQTRPSPKQPKQPTPPKPIHKPAPKSNPPSGRMTNKPNPMANAQKQVPRPPSAPAMAPAPTQAPTAPMAVPPATMQVAPAAPMASAPAPQAQATSMGNTQSMPQNPFTNATFTLDPMNNDAIMQPGSGDTNLDMPMIDMSTFGTDAPEGHGNTSNDPAMDDLDRFFDMGGENNENEPNSSDFANYDVFDFDLDKF